MKKRLIVIFMMIAMAAVLGAETKVIPMPDLMKVDQIFFDDTQMYVTEGTTIYIYSKKDFKLIKKFGKKGEGPEEFMLDLNSPMAGLLLSRQGKDLLVHSLGKVSWYTTGGEYIKEQKLPTPMMLFVQAMGKNIVGRRISMGQPMMMTLTLYDSGLKPIKDLAQKPHVFQFGKGTSLLDFPPPIAVSGDKCFLAWEKDFAIKVVGSSGKELYTIKRKEKKRKVSDKDKKDIVDFMRTSPQTKAMFDMMKPFHFSEYYPAIQTITPSGGKLYVLTFNEDKNKDDECLVMDLKGKLLKRVYLPVQMSTPVMPYPFTMHEGVLYQFVENEDEEEWSLHVTKIL